MTSSSHTEMAKIFAFVALALVCLSQGATAQSLELPALPYKYDALEPYFDEATMKIHHLAHHQAYTNTINQALTALRADEATKPLAKMGIDTLLKHLAEVPEALRQSVRNGGGGFVNHDIFWKSLTPGGSPEPTADSLLGAAINTAFGSFLELQNAFNEKATKVFGSGWAWLVCDEMSGELAVMATPNQDTPMMAESTAVLLGLDVWEHAYYLKYQNKRPDYVSAFWKVINWEVVAQRHKACIAKINGKKEL
mmetsp:Transcript_1720/g.3582  ORF Transcript_1720/g.3582 Transcript_1720/m.3582 type:complete len:252 (+) Transcript_1720:1-756(+)